MEIINPTTNLFKFFITEKCSLELAI